MGAPFMANSQIGFFYPLNWPFWLLSSTPYAMSLSIILHLLIAASGVFLMSRRCLALSRPAAILGAVLFSLGGYFTAQVEHINQIQGIAWLPWYFVILCAWRPGGTRRQSVKLSVGFAFVLSLQILSGHTQTVFISMIAVVGWLLLSYVRGSDAIAEGPTEKRSIVRRAKQALSFLTPVILGIVLAAGMTAVQLMPTLELSAHSMRQGGLPPNEVLSFSLQPLSLGQSLLPFYEKLIFSEYVLFVPISALLLAAIGARWMWRTRPARSFVVLAALGLALALGRFNPVYYLLARLPGFNLFRAPARWSVLYALVIALLAAAGWHWLYRTSLGREPEKDRSGYVGWLIVGAALICALVAWSILSGPVASFVPAAPETTVEGPSVVTLAAWIVEFILASLLILLLIRGRAPAPMAWVLLVGVVVILFISTRILPYNHPTTARAYFEQRAPVSRMLAAQDCQPPAESCQTGAERLLGLSDIFFDLGDQPEIDSVFGGKLGPRELFDYVVATKQKEILGPNLPLAYDLRSVDGFDGGVLPLQSYALSMSIVLPEGQETFDGRLREHLDTIPDERWLDHFGAKYIITDKVGDQWRNGIFFDMKHPVTLTGNTGAVPVGFLPSFEATELYMIGDGSPGTLAMQEREGERWLIAPERVEDDLWRARLPHPAILTSLKLNPCQGSDESKQCVDGWQIGSIALVDSRDGSFTPLVLGDYRLIFSGDVKIYENLDVSPLASLIFDWQFAENSQVGLAIMEADGFEPKTTAVLSGLGPEAPGAGYGEVLVESYAPEKITLKSESDRPALLLVREAFYPGWQAMIDGKAAEIVQTDVLFRGIFVPAGAHTIELTYRPASYQIGLIVTLLGLTLWFVSTAYAFLPIIGRSRRFRSRTGNHRT
jgi:hypothetical protein